MNPKKFYILSRYLVFFVPQKKIEENASERLAILELSYPRVHEFFFFDDIVVPVAGFFHMCYVNRVVPQVLDLPTISKG